MVLVGKEIRMHTHDVTNYRSFGESDALKRLRRDIEAIAPLDSNVLLTGETGTGKGRAARLLHERSPRANSPFVHVDCAALAGGLIESELFGHERGAFTSAAQQHIGRFERAGRGTIFLDEIGDLAQNLQAKLMRVLEDREYERVGGMQTLRMRARVIAASSRSLFPADSQGAFRTDLYFRLSVFHIELPPLRERAEDLPELVGDGLDRLCAAQQIARPEVSDEFLARLARHDWPGNVRELLNTLERVLAMHRDGPLRAGEVDAALLARANPSHDDLRELVTLESPSLQQEVAKFERREILDALKRAGGNVSDAARRLAIPRGTLRHKIRKHALLTNPEEPAS